MKKICIFLIFIFLFSKNLLPTIIDGTSNINYQSKNFVFHNGDLAQGFVRFNSGFTVLNDASALLDTFITVSGDLDFRSTGKIRLLDDLYLDTSVTFTGSGGMIDGRGKKIFLQGNFSLPDNYVLNITGDTIIDGNGRELSIGRWAQITVDSDVTLTLRNLTLKNTYTNYTVTPIRPCAINSRVALDNVQIKMADDFSLDQGQLFIHNDVVISGTYKFSCRSVEPTRIMHDSCLYFDNGTTFEYYPACTNNGLLYLQDKSSSIYLDECTLQATHTGIKLTSGRLFLDNAITLTNTTNNTAWYSLTLQATIDYGTKNDSELGAAALRQDGVYLAIGGRSQSLIDASVLRLYRFNGYDFQFITSADYGTEIWTLDWHPTGQFLAVAGKFPTNGNEIQVYRFDGSSLSLVSSVAYGTKVFTVAWRPDGRFLAVGGTGPTNSNEIQIYSFENQALSLVNSVDYGDEVHGLGWSPDGEYFVAGGYNPTNSKEIQLYSFDGATITLKDSQDYPDPSGSSIAFSPRWHPNGNYFAVGGSYSEATDIELRVYAFRRSIEKMSLVSSANFTNEAQAMSWAKNGKYLGVGGITSSNFIIFTFDGVSITATPGLSALFGFAIVSFLFTPNEKYCLAAGIATNRATDPELKLYKIGQRFDTTALSFSNAMVFGDSLAGQDYDLDVNILSDANVELDGLLNLDNVN